MIIKKILGDYDKFLDNVFQGLQKKGIDVADYHMDHICYRVFDNVRYEIIKMFLDNAGCNMLSQEMIAGRPIAVYCLKDPILYKDRLIKCLELPAPKNGKFTPEGFEHVEFAIGDSFEDFMQKYPDIDFDTFGIAKIHNPELKLSLDKIAVKFHKKPLCEF